ncbi:bis(5'-nucleosyl)-tetraphosphatase (symmetrical) YqeK [Atopobiaceae bacterium 24-176]
MSADAPDTSFFTALLEKPSVLAGEQAKTVLSLEQDLSRHLASRPKRLAHSLSVGRTAEALAFHYGVDPFEARVAGILHDWEKARPDAELVGPAREAGIDFGAPLELVFPLIHGVLAARTLPERYPWLSSQVLTAIARHTTGAAQMSPLDEVLFVADGIEPLRGSKGPLDAQRALVATSSLDGLYRTCFCDGMAYVIQTRRYLYPGTLDIYNELVTGKDATKR